MLIVFPKISKQTDLKDWPYMKQSDEVLKNPPQTWAAYPGTTAGMKAIIDMEYQEFINAYTAGKPMEEIMQELVHLGSATLALWRKYHAAQ